MEGEGQPVLLNIYDMFWTNQYTSMLGVGVFHTGIEVYDLEFAYGGHPFHFSGVFEITPKDAEDLGDHYKYKETIHLGYTCFTKEEVRQAVSHLGRDFKGSNYHLMSKNCNHFSGELSQLLCGQEIPTWVNRLAYISTCIPFLEKAIPKDWLTPTALEATVRAATEGEAEEPQENNRKSSSSSMKTFFEMISSGNQNGSKSTSTNNTSATGSPSSPTPPKNK